MGKQRRSGVLSIGVAAGVLATSGVLAAGTASGAVQPRATSSGWHRLSAAAVTPTSSVGLARFGSSLQVVWVQAGATSQSLLTRVVGKSGAPTSAAKTVASGWATLNNFPTVFANGDQRIIAFSGQRDAANENDPYTKGFEYYLTSSDGTSWALSPNALSEHSMASSSQGSDGVDAGGTPVVGYTDGATTAVEYHSGFVTPIPAAAGGESQTTPTAVCCSSDTGLGYDAKSKTTWAVWYSNGNQFGSHGILAQPILPSLGTQVVAPNSFTSSAGNYQSVSPNQRIVTAARTGGGVYASYFVGYPTATKVALWRLGAPTAKTHSAGGNAAHVGVAAAPKGRLWLYWWNLRTHTVNVTETNSAATTFGKVCHVATPGKTTGVWDLVGNASKGPLQLFTIAGGQAKAQVYDTVIKSC